MPELPEIQAAARTLAAAAAGKTIARFTTLHPALQRRLPPRHAAQLRQRRIERVARRGKHQLLHLGGDLLLVVHFRMTGAWTVGRTDYPVARYTRAVLDLTDGTRISLIDLRALATLELRVSSRDPLPRLGLDALDPRLDAHTLHSELARKRCAIKPALLDQHVIAGLGNIYTTEALWYARIDPRTPARRLARVRLARLLDGIRTALAHVPATGRDPPAGARPRREVYHRAGEPCRRCDARIVRIRQSGRATYLCPRCQRR